MKIIIGLIEHAGDIIACEPVARYLREKYPSSEITWAVVEQYRELIDTNPHITTTHVVGCLTDWIKLTKHNNYDKVVDLHVNYRVCSHCKIPLYKTSGNPLVNAYEWFDYGALLEAFSIGAGLPKLNEQPRIYLQPQHTSFVDQLGLSADYCVIHRASNNFDKDWQDSRWDGLIRWLTQDLNMQVVDIGLDEKHNRSSFGPNFISLINQTTLLQSAEVIRRAQLFVGVDSGPAHLANAVMTPGVILLGELGFFKHYNPFTGFYARESQNVKLVRNLTGPARLISSDEVLEAVDYLLKLSSYRRLQNRNTTTEDFIDEDRDVAHPEDQRAKFREIILASGLFDPVWYLRKNPDVANAKVDPLQHFIENGAKEGRAPGPNFEERWYRALNLTEEERKIPLVRYLIQNYARKVSRAHDTQGNLSKPVHSSTSNLQTIYQEFTVNAAEFLAPRDSSVKAEISLPRVLAMYLPQFHPIPENNWAHGMGFTEWTNVTKARPLFEGHYQPRVPGELGYYDLRSEDVLTQQLDLALEHGITGFCFYYYYFQGKKLLYKPIENFLKSSSTAPFAFIWANENWSRRWDGGDLDIIIEQHHSHEDDLVFINDLMSTFEDERYIKIGGKPLLMIYKSQLFPVIERTIDTWRAEIAKKGYPGIYLVMVDDWTASLDHPRKYGFDATYEIPSNIVPREVMVDDISVFRPVDSFEGSIVDYYKFAKFHLSRPFPTYKRFRTVMLPWDNTARYGKKAIVHVNTENEAYSSWLSQAYLDTYKHYQGDERLLFIHSWNEWCEGTYLEPDEKYGRKYLRETRDTIRAAREAIGMAERSGLEAESIILLRKIEAAKEEGSLRILDLARTQARDLEGRAADLARKVDEMQAEIDRLHKQTRWKSKIWPF